MKNLHTLKHRWLQLAFLAVPFVAIAAEWSRFPARIAIHWGLGGRPDGWSNKTVGLLIIPLLNVALALLLAWLPRLDPKLRRNPPPDEGLTKMYVTIQTSFAAVFSFISLLVAATALGHKFKFFQLFTSAELVLLIVIGNFMGRLRPNYFFGIRTPWTLESPEVWRATHRIGGRIVVFGSIALLALQFVLKPAHLSIALLAFLGALAVWSLVYSYWRFRSTSAPPA
jgi:uncharacterized membrane protein